MLKRQQMHHECVRKTMHVLCVNGTGIVCAKELFNGVSLEGCLISLLRSLAMESGFLFVKKSIVKSGKEGQEF